MHKSLKSRNRSFKVETPKVELPSIGSGKSDKSSGSSSVSLPGGKDKSGLFSNITDDPSADVHRKNAVTNLTALEAEYAKASVDYVALTKLMFETDASWAISKSSQK